MFKNKTINKDHILSHQYFLIKNRIQNKFAQQNYEELQIKKIAYQTIHVIKFRIELEDKKINIIKIRNYKIVSQKTLYKTYQRLNVRLLLKLQNHQINKVNFSLQIKLTLVM